MVWQDLVFALGSIVFIIALVPTIFSGKKPSIWTSVPTCLVLYAFALTYLEMGFEFAAATTFVSATLWDIIAIQTLYLLEVEGINWEKEEENHRAI